MFLFLKKEYICSPQTVIVAQLVRAPDCGSGGRGFESRLSPPSPRVVNNLFMAARFFKY